MENLYDKILLMKKYKLKPEQMLVECNIAIDGQDEVEKILAINSKIDLDNNRKSNNSFNMYTNKTQTTPKSGPRIPDQSYKPQPPSQNISGSPEKGDINPIELQKDREKVYNFNDYSHQLDKNDYTDLLKQQQRDKYNQKRRDNRWQKSTDNMFKNRKDSDNRKLYNMEKDINDNNENDQLHPL
jgi:hypothetical protein